MTRKYPMMALLMAALLTSAVQASEQNDQRDEQAVSALKAMSAYLAGLKSFTVTGVALEDYQLEAGLMATYPTEIELTVTRPGSLPKRQFDGESTRDLYIHEGSLTLYDSAKKYYATTSVPAGLDAGMDYALEELGIDAPLMDLVYMDPSTRLAGTTDPVLYLTGKSRVDGVDCHQLAIRVEDADVQLWVQEGNSPLPRRIMITAKWEAGSPRFNAQMNWNTQPDISGGAFEFEPPEDAVQIQFERLD
jgi:hypothetical protein